MTPSDLVNDLSSYSGTGFNIHLDTLKEWVFSVENLGGFILGVVTILLLLGLGFITCLDFIYLTIPTARDTYENYRNNKIKEDSARLFRIDLVSKDAVDSVAEGYKTNSSPIVHYVKKRFKTYLFATIMLMILITGPNVIVRFIANIIGELIDLIKGLSG